MSKKILIIILIGVLAAGGFISFLVWKHYSKPNLPLKHYCQTDSDCVLSGSDPEGFGICVNKEWYEEWKKSPESKKYKWTCEYTGKEKCGCINNKCQRIDSERECGVKKRQATITTDKTEYEQGEIIKITLKNNLNESIFAYVERIPISCFCIESIERKTSEGSWEKLSPVGNNLELLASISKAKETIQELIRVLDELYETIQSGSTPDIEARIKEYLNISVLVVERVEKVSSEFQSTTDIRLSPKEYHEIKSRFYDGLIDISTDSFLLTSYLDNYLKDPKNHSVLDKTKNQIKKVRKTAYSLKNFYASLIEPQEIKPGQYKTFEWTPLLKGTPLPIQASPGKYRINVYVWINGIKKNFYSNEFIIKEKK